jgi:hypothetical protein
MHEFCSYFDLSPFSTHFSSALSSHSHRSMADYTLETFSSDQSWFHSSNWTKLKKLEDR